MESEGTFFEKKYKNNLRGGGIISLVLSFLYPSHA